MRIRSGGSELRFIVGPDVDSQYHQEIYDLACRDADTEAFSRAFFDTALRQEVSAAPAMKSTVILELVRLPPTSGPEASGAQIQTLAAELKPLARAGEVVARFDETTLAILVCGGEADEAEARAGALERAARSVCADLESAVSSLRADEDHDDLLARVLERLGAPGDPQ
jgi:GGDEF domain-containing protein